MMDWFYIWIFSMWWSFCMVSNVYFYPLCNKCSLVPLSELLLMRFIWLFFGFTIYFILTIFGGLCNPLFIVYFISGLVILSVFLVIFGLYLCFLIRYYSLVICLIVLCINFACVQLLNESTCLVVWFMRYPELLIIFKGFDCFMVFGNKWDD